MGGKLELFRVIISANSFDRVGQSSLGEPIVQVITGVKGRGWWESNPGGQGEDFLY